MISRLRFFVKIWRCGRSIPLLRAWRLTMLFDKFCGSILPMPQLAYQEAKILQRRR